MVSEVIYPLRSFIDVLIARVEEPLLSYPHVELILVMVVFPAMLTSLFAWIVDNLIKDREVHETLEEDAPVRADLAARKKFIELMNRMNDLLHQFR